MTSILLTEEQLEAQKAEARNQREAWAKIQSTSSDDLSEWQAHERKNNQKRDSRGRIMGSGGSDVGDTTLNVFFERRKVLHKMKTLNAGKPQYIEMDFITIIPPGLEKELVQHSPVNAFYEHRFGKEYSNWKAGIKTVDGGTPLEDWEDLKDDKDTLDEMKRRGVHTVEQLMTAPDTVAINHLQTWKTLAQKFLAAKVKSDEQKKIDDMLAGVRAEYDAQIAAQQKQINALIEASSKLILPDEKPKKVKSE